MAVARVVGIGHQDRVVAIDEQCQHQQQRCRRTGGHDDPLRRHRHAVMVGIVLRQRLPQFRDAERRRVVDAAVFERAGRGGQHRRRRGEIGLADFHVDDRAAGRFQRPRGGLDFHHVERRDVGDPGGELQAGLHRMAYGECVSKTVS
jgi:hypothetical protein